jgi:hypothetical protein
MTTMSSSAQVATVEPSEVVRQAPVSQAPNGVCYAQTGETAISSPDLERMVGAVPRAIAAGLERKAFYFVPLTVSDGDQTLIADRYDVALSDQAVCHRNLKLGNSQCIFISTRLMDDRFSVAFEFYINVGHNFVDRAGVSQDFAELAWSQVERGVRGETSMDAYELRQKSMAGVSGGSAQIDEKAKSEYLSAAFSDAIAIYMLSLYLDVDYYDLREREYPLLAPQAMSERLRKVAELFPPNPGFEFNIFYRRR